MGRNIVGESKGKCKILLCTIEGLLTGYASIFSYKELQKHII